MRYYQAYISALRQCAEEHKDDKTPTAHIIVSYLCRETADLLETLEQESCEDCVSRSKTAVSISRWVPVSEELPTEGELVLTQANFKDGARMAVSKRVDYNYWTGWETRDVNIVAWMPLPEPYYKEEMESKE